MSGKEPYTILVVDADRAYRKDVREALEGIGYKVVEAHDGKSALRALGLSGSHYKPIDAVVSDILLGNPEQIDGIMLLRQIKEELPQVPFIIHSLYDYRGFFDVNNADEYLIKNGNVGELTKTIEELLKRKN
jgi:CheY-like chemotaxis protein